MKDLFLWMIMGMVFIGAILISLFQLTPTPAGIIGAFIGLLIFSIKKTKEETMRDQPKDEVKKNIERATNMSNDEAKQQFVAFELSIEYKIEKDIKLDENEVKFIDLKDELAIKLGITPQLHKELRNELISTWQFVLKRD